MTNQAAYADRIVAVTYRHLPGTKMIICEVLLDNKFIQVGTHTFTDREEFNLILGKQNALNDAIEKLYPLFRFLELEGHHLECKRKAEALHKLTKYFNFLQMEKSHLERVQQ